MSKMGKIRVILEYQFPDDLSNEEIKRQIQDIKLPKEYVEDKFEYVGIWKTTEDNKLKRWQRCFVKPLAYPENEEVE